jgi:hypothetical protein
LKINSVALNYDFSFLNKKTPEKCLIIKTYPQYYIENNKAGAFITT